jgi:pyridinium-3,5-biscarboxylic acid mononucleotide sulfurtransferase
MPSLRDLEAAVATADRVVVAFSGGVDSSLVAAISHRVLGSNAVAVTAVSPALATGELEGARQVARAIGIEHRAVYTDELAREGYRRNGPDRCYHCKSELYDVLGTIARDRADAAVFSGANVDDLGDFRPGLRAASDHHVRHPLVEAGFGKVDVRSLARTLRLPSAEKPAAPCLASRLPFGTEVDPGTLAQVDRAEMALKRLGYRELRVRHLGETARVELATGELRGALEPTSRAALEDAVRAAGYANVQIDPEPFRSGSLTRSLRRPLRIVAT